VNAHGSVEEPERLDAQNRILARIAANAPLTETLDSIARYVEARCPGTLCTIVLLDEDGVHIRRGAAPSLPAEFMTRIDGLEIGEGAGSCGTAMHRRETVVTVDVFADPLWSGYRALAELGGVRACWSTPIFSDVREVLGSFAVYYREPRAPAPAERAEVDVATHISGIAIQQWKGREALRRAGERLADSERRFRQIAENVREVFWITDPRKQQMLYVSPAYESIWGRSCESLYERPISFTEAIHPEDRPTVVERLALQSQGTYDETYRIIRPDGSVRWIHDRAYPVREADGSVRTVVGGAQDITPQKDAERALRDAEARQRSLFENAPDGILVADTQGRYLDANRNALAMLGYTRAEFLRLRSEDVVVPRLHGRVPAALAEINDGAEHRREWVFRRKDGSEFHVDIMAATMPDGRILAHVRDVTERRHLDDVLRESERRFRTLLSNLHLASLMIDREGRITHCNDFLLQLTGWSADEVLGRNCFEVFLPSDQAEGVRGVLSGILLDKPEAWHHENEIVTRAGVRRLIRWNNSVLRSADGEAVGMASIGEDVTDQKRLEGQLRQSQKMEAIGRLAGGVAHDFNNVLGVITGYGEMLRRGVPEGHADRRRLDQILRAAQRAAGLTRQLLAFSRRQVLEPRVLEPTSVVADLRGMLDRLIGEDVEFRVSARAAGRVKVDPGQLEQVVMNLVVNARDAMPTGGVLSVETTDVDLDQEYVQRRETSVQPGRYVMIAVTDTGVGMDDATQARIFEPFFTTKAEGKGTGLGLATVYGIVKQSGGYIWLYSEVGMGTVFRVYLPRVEEALAVEQLRSMPKRRTPNETVLVVEDEPAARELVGEILEGEGYKVLLASNGQEAVEVAQRTVGPIHLLLTDVVLPRLGGRAAAETICRTRPETRVLYMSGYTDDEVSRHGILEPGILLLQKPFTPNDLIERIARVLDENQ
jgi:PAS domain S-box-containing protein